MDVYHYVAIVLISGLIKKRRKKNLLFGFFSIVPHKLPADTRWMLCVHLCAGVCLYQLFLSADVSGDLVLVNQEVVIVNVSKHRLMEWQRRV